jgi:hypothetical protein
LAPPVLGGDSITSKLGEDKEQELVSSAALLLDDIIDNVVDRPLDDLAIIALVVDDLVREARSNGDINDDALL